ncbi:MAG: caspase family protein [Bradyrhizobium sp.]|uniref:caspase family protein n=1 Tax=Bradyrhizobium sp. TaxID=376 RepID=UPI001DA0F003|nr:caspase family protein [Bradyrhizobium sp.]MBV9563773.1 caspase family protein [Bradyrhizobium sp.]
MSRFKTLLHGLALLAGLGAFGPVFAQGANPETAITEPPPPRALAEPSTTVVATNSETPATPRGPEQRVALVIGNSHYRNAAPLPNPDNDAQSMAEFLGSAGFDVIAATDLTQSDMIKVVQQFTDRVASRGPNTVAMIYYAGHGVQLAGENYLIPVDARISAPSDLLDNSVRLVDLMATLETIPSRLRIVVLDACRNNPFPTVNDAGRGLAIVDAPNGSIVGYSTAPGEEALDGVADHSPYTAAFLKLAREPNQPIEQLFKRVRLEVNQATGGQQTPWESSSLTSEFYFFGDTAVAAGRAPANAPVVQLAANLPSRSMRQAYDFVVSEGSPEYYQEFIRMFPDDPLCDRIRRLLANLLEETAWHHAVQVNSPLAYKAFSDSYGKSVYGPVALRLAAQPKPVSIVQPTRLLVPPSFKLHDEPTRIVSLPAGPHPTIPATGGKHIADFPANHHEKFRNDLRRSDLHQFHRPAPAFRPHPQTFARGQMGGGMSNFNSHFASPRFAVGGHGGGFRH